MRVVAALGGNALLRRGQPFDLDRQRENARRAARALVPLAAQHELVVTHGNGPQIGFLARGAAGIDPTQQHLDVLGAESEGLIGYLLEQALRNELPERSIATLLTQTLVDSKDPAFATPEKPVGPRYSPDEAERLGAELQWRFVAVGAHRRRVVASPAPQGILQVQTIRVLLDAGVLPICAGGGGIPVVRDDRERLCGAEAVVDKDLASALLATEIGADHLLLLTDVDAVYRDWDTERARAYTQVTPAALSANEFEAGSMAPKVAAACAFAEADGRASIGAMEDAPRLYRGECGTQVSRGSA